MAYDTEPLWLAVAASVVRHLPRGRYRAMDALARVIRVPAFEAPFPRCEPGMTFECDLRNALAREVYFTGQYEPQETALLEALLKPGQTFVDVGAHWGYFSLIAAERVGKSGRVISIEADPRIYRTLEHNAARNALKQVETIHVAAAAQEGTLRMAGYSPTDGNWGVSRLLGSKEFTEKANIFDVRTVAIDRLLDKDAVQYVDVLKMDIEGAEALALFGMESGLRAGRYGTLVIEFHPAALPDFGSSVRALVDFLSGFGYRAWRIDHSKKGMRHAAYHPVRPRSLLTPWTPSSAIDNWPHLLWSLHDPTV